MNVSDTLDMSKSSYKDAAAIRLACREGEFRSPTAGFAPGQIQANVIILPSHRLAGDFKNLCARNPVPCPLLGFTAAGDPRVPSHLARECDIRTDLPLYAVYQDGKMMASVPDITHLWQADSVAFFIGCSFSFETQLIAHGLMPRHIELERNVAMYRSRVPLCPAGKLGGHMIVSMRPYRTEDIERVRDITRPFSATHGEPVAWGFDGARELGIDLSKHPDFGDSVPIREDEVPVFWGCGVTPQQSVMESKVDGIVIGHAPGHMLCLDMLESELVGVSQC